MVHSRVPDQVPALVICRRAGVCEHQGNRFGDVHGAPPSDADDPGGKAALPGIHRILDLLRQEIDIGGLGLHIHIHPENKIPAVARQSILEGLVLEGIIHTKDHDGTAVLSLRRQDLIQLIEAPPAENNVGNHSEVSEHGEFSFLGPFSLRFFPDRDEAGVKELIGAIRACQDKAR
jgi:hypothetical protein